MKTFSNILFISISAALLIFFIWFGISYIDVIMNNMSANPQYADWNFFSLLVSKV